MKKLRDNPKIWELNARYNYWVDTHTWQAVTLLVGPYTLTLLFTLLFKNPWVIAISLCWLPFMIGFIIWRDFDVMKKFQYTMDKYQDIRDHFSDRWLRRGPSQFIYFKTINDFTADIHIYDLEKSWFDVTVISEEWDNYKKFDAVTTHRWSMSSSRVATEREKDEYGLNAIEARILLNKE